MKARKVAAYFFLFLPISLIISCHNENEKKQKNIQSTKTSNYEEALKEISRKLEAAVIETDYETILNYYTEDVIIVPNFNPVIEGKTALRESFLKQKREGVKFSSFNTKTDKIWEDNLNVYEYGSYGMSISSNETKHPYAYTGSYFVVWEKQKEKHLLIKYMISNLDFNPCKYYD